MAVSKTKLKLVDVARQLFAKNGMENTTMNDIAQASGKGRRTLYTYFKSKDEIYYAVIEGEMERIYDKMTEVAESKTELEDKLVSMVYTHLDVLKQAVIRNGNLRAEFFRNIWAVEKARKHFDQMEIKIFSEILEQGSKMGRFEVDNVPLLADVLHYCVKGLEVPYIYGRLGKDLTMTTSRPIVERIVYRLLGL